MDTGDSPKADCVVDLHFGLMYCLESALIITNLAHLYWVCDAHKSVRPSVRLQGGGQAQVRGPGHKPPRAPLGPQVCTTCCLCYVFRLCLACTKQTCILVSQHNCLHERAKSLLEEDPSGGMSCNSCFAGKGANMRFALQALGP